MSPRVVVPDQVPGETKAERVRAMFSRIVTRYDLMNRLMTMGLDGAWRSAAVREAAPENGLALDVGTGTGDLALELARSGARRVVGIDFVPAMLATATQKAATAANAEVVLFACGDALMLPFADGTFDCVVNGFVLRNVADLPTALAEMARVVKPGGRVVCLELTHPPWLVAPWFGFYFSRLVPLLGGAITGQIAAYRYLPASLEPLPDVWRLADLLRAAGLSEVHHRRLGLGTVAIHVGTKRAAAPGTGLPQTG